MIPREISPYRDLSVDDALKHLPSKAVQLVNIIREQKNSQTRPTPSTTLLDKSSLLTHDIRCQLVDQVAKLVDENLVGRHEMCEQFAVLLTRALNRLGIEAKAVAGECVYYANSRKVHAWRHVWVRVDNEIIDANVDVNRENPHIPTVLNTLPYWGPANQVPTDRKLRQDRAATLAPDEDVDLIWWPELAAWVDSLANQQKPPCLVV